MLRLTHCQTKALGDLIAACVRREQWALHGAAGTGKTTLVQQLHRALSRAGVKSLFAAPTHKAAGVLRSKMNGPVRTVASICNMVREVNEDKERFVIKYRHDPKRPRLDGAQVLIVDESSMLRQDAADCLVEICDNEEAALILVGDPFQLPPIGSETLAAQFMEPINGKIFLDEVVRHAGPILELATNIRNSFSAYHRLPSVGNHGEESSVVVYDNSREWAAKAIEIIKSDEWLEDPSTARFVCWSNESCAGVTTRLRKLLYGEDSYRGFVPGELLMNSGALKAPGDEASQIAHSCREWLVVESEPVDLEADEGGFKGIEFKAAAKAQRLIIEPAGGGEEVQVYAPLPGCKAWKKQCDSIYGKLTRLKKKGVPIPATAWTGFRDLRSWCTSGQNLNSATVMTVHNSQGSTFKHTFIYDDIAHCRYKERNSLLYVALTRASHTARFFRARVYEPNS